MMTPNEDVDEVSAEAAFEAMMEAGVGGEQGVQEAALDETVLDGGEQQQGVQEMDAVAGVGGEQGVQEAALDETVLDGGEQQQGVQEVDAVAGVGGEEGVQEEAALDTAGGDKQAVLDGGLGALDSEEGNKAVGEDGAVSRDLFGAAAAYSASAAAAQNNYNDNNQSTSDSDDDLTLHQLREREERKERETAFNYSRPLVMSTLLHGKCCNQT